MKMLNSATLTTPMVSQYVQEGKSTIKVNICCPFIPISSCRLRNTLEIGTWTSSGSSWRNIWLGWKKINYNSEERFLCFLMIFFSLHTLKRTINTLYKAPLVVTHLFRCFNFSFSGKFISKKRTELIVNFLKTFNALASLSRVTRRAFYYVAILVGHTVV